MSDDILASVTPRIERIARALCIADNGKPDMPWPSFPPSASSGIKELQRPRWHWHIKMAIAAEKAYAEPSA